MRTRLIMISTFCILSFYAKAEIEITESKDEVQTTTASEKNTKTPRSPDSFAQLRIKMGLSAPISDFRKGLEGRIPNFSIDPVDLTSGGIIEVQNTQFDIRLLTFEWDGGSGHLIGQIPIRNLRYSSPPTQLTSAGQDLSQGAELGGYFAGIEFQLQDFISFTFGYEDLRSDRLKLIEPVSFISSQMELSNYENFSSDYIFAYKIWGQHLAVKNKSSYLEYGSQNTLGLNIGLNLSALSSLPFRIGSDFQVSRVNSFKIMGNELGGGGIGAASPYLEYALTPEIILGAHLEIPLFAPKGREEIFGHSRVAGLFGRTVSFSVALR